MTTPVNNPTAGEPYEAFIVSALPKLRKELESAELPTETIDIVMTKADFALQTTRLLFNGPPLETMLRKPGVDGGKSTTATRIMNRSGVPVWSVTPGDGGKPWEVEEPILTPEADWICVYDPRQEPA